MTSTIQSFISQITSHPLFRKHVGEALGKKCYKSLVEKLNYRDSECTQLALSKAIGAAIVVGGGLVKLPQILKILYAKSAKGLSLSSYLLETIAYSVTLAYNYRNKNPFSTYGETFFVTIQNCIIIMLMLSYSQRNLLMVLLTLVIGGLNYALYMNDVVDAQTMQILQAATIPVSILSKLPQIYQNYSAGTTGQLSAFTVFMYFFGSVARVFTTMKEVKDPIILLGFVLASALNGILLLQLLYYWNSGGRGAKPTSSKRKNE